MTANELKKLRAEVAKQNAEAEFNRWVLKIKSAILRGSLSNEDISAEAFSDCVSARAQIIVRCLIDYADLTSYWGDGTIMDEIKNCNKDVFNALRSLIKEQD